MKIKCIYSLVITFLVQGSLLGSYDQARENEKKINRYWSKFGKNLAKKHFMSICGIGGGMNEKVHLLSIRFQVKKNLSKNEARILMLDCINELLANINQTEEIKPLLSNYPFNEKNIEISFLFIDKENIEVFYPYLNNASLVNGNIHYRTVAPENINRYKTKEFETYQDALQKVNQIPDEN